MILSLRFHMLFYGGLLVWGLFDLVSAAGVDTSVTKIVMGVLYLVVAGYQLPRHQKSEEPVTSVQRVR